jgi:molybdopterin-biosynthesis enzyme MoeA-like protein
MLEWVLDTHYRAAFGSAAATERSLTVFEMPESALVPLMREIEARYAAVRTFSLPSVGDGSDGRVARRHIELGVKGAVAAVPAAYADLRAGVVALGCEFAER